MSRLIAITHHNCQDGFMSSTILRRFARDLGVQFVPVKGNYGATDLSGIMPMDSVVIADFSLPRDDLARLAKICPVTWIDHHKTAIDDWNAWHDRPTIVTQLDLNKSGALLTWEWCFPQVMAPQIVRHVSDRDLWQFKLENTEAIAEWLFSHPFDYEFYDRLLNSDALGFAADEGHAILRMKRQIAQNLIDENLTVIERDGYNVGVLNTPTHHTSMALSMLLEQNPDMGYAMSFFHEGKTGNIVFSLRSKDGRADVGAVAKLHGGGGHRNASGFKLGKSQAAALYPELFAGRTRIFFTEGD